jgi:hypothetical protein
MNETLDTQDMNITLDSFGRLVSTKGFFGSAPIRREGEPVVYDEVSEDTVLVSDYETEFTAEDAEVINE